MSILNNNNGGCGCNSCGCNNVGYGGGNHTKNLINEDGSPVFTGSGGGQGPTPPKDGISIPTVDLGSSDLADVSDAPPLNVINDSDASSNLGSDIGGNLFNPITTIITVGAYVKDEFGNPLPDANIYEEGDETNGAITDADGLFVLQVKRTARVIVSFIGLNSNVYTASEIPTIVILSGSEQLDDVVLNVPKVKPNYLGWGLGLGLLILGMRIFKEDNPKNTPRNPSPAKKSRTVKATL